MGIGSRGVTQCHIDDMSDRLFKSIMQTIRFFWFVVWYTPYGMVDDGLINGTYRWPTENKGNDWRVLGNDYNELLMWLRRATTACADNDLAARSVD